MRNPLRTLYPERRHQERHIVAGSSLARRAAETFFIVEKNTEGTDTEGRLRN